MHPYSLGTTTHTRPPTQSLTYASLGTKSGAVDKMQVQVRSCHISALWSSLITYNHARTHACRQWLVGWAGGWVGGSGGDDASGWTTLTLIWWRAVRPHLVEGR